MPPLFYDRNATNRPKAGGTTVPASAAGARMFESRTPAPSNPIPQVQGPSTFRPTGYGSSPMLPGEQLVRVLPDGKWLLKSPSGAMVMVDPKQATTKTNVSVPKAPAPKVTAPKGGGNKNTTPTAPTSPTPPTTAVTPGQGGATIPSLSAEEAALFNEQRSQVGSQFQDMINQLGRERMNASIGTQEALRSIGRQASGEAADWASAAAETGLGLSPAMAGIGGEQISTAAARERAKVKSAWADALAQLSGTQYTGASNRDAALRRIAANELAARAGRAKSNVASMYQGVQ